MSLCHVHICIHTHSDQSPVNIPFSYFSCLFKTILVSFIPMNCQKTRRLLVRVGISSLSLSLSFRGHITLKMWDEARKFMHFMDKHNVSSFWSITVTLPLGDPLASGRSILMNQGFFHSFHRIQNNSGSSIMKKKS